MRTWYTRIQLHLMSWLERRRLLNLNSGPCDYLTLRIGRNLDLV